MSTVKMPTGVSSARWVEATTPKTAAGLIESGLSATLAGMLARREITSGEEAQRFLQPSLEQLHDPFLLRGMESAVTRLLAARAQGEKVVIVGDYDVDGITATAMLVAVFRALKLEVTSLLPQRLTEGYGFQAIHVQSAVNRGCRLLVTADCGSRAYSAIEEAHRVGIDVIVTDHHRSSEPLPDGVIEINPHHRDCSYPFPDLSGVGLALKLSMALAERAEHSFEVDRLLRIACLGTIADLVPLRGENRAIAALGLRAFSNNRSPGLRALCRMAKVKPPVEAADVGFRIGPRLNAAGRVDSPDAALELLLTRDTGRAEVLAAQLEQWNRRRQDEEKLVVEQARERISRRSAMAPIIVDWSPDWHQGVVGIAAGRIAREFHRPTVLLGVSETMATGSGRSVPGIDIYSFISAWETDLDRFGGHPQAIGLSVSVSQLESLRHQWEEKAKDWSAEDLQPLLRYEHDFSAGESIDELLQRFSVLEPFGAGNQQPLIRIRSLELQGRPRLFGNGHLSAIARTQSGSVVRLLGWGWAAHKEIMVQSFDILGAIEADHYRNQALVRIVDLKSSSNSGTSQG
jgi:single-stranded-DNA-specific exonuclease